MCTYINTLWMTIKDFSIFSKIHISTNTIVFISNSWPMWFTPTRCHLVFFWALNDRIVTIAWLFNFPFSAICFKTNSLAAHCLIGLIAIFYAHVLSLASMFIITLNNCGKCGSCCPAFWIVGVIKRATDHYLSCSTLCFCSIISLSRCWLINSIIFLVHECDITIIKSHKTSSLCYYSIVSIWLGITNIILDVRSFASFFTRWSSAHASSYPFIFLMRTLSYRFNCTFHSFWC